MESPTSFSEYYRTVSHSELLHILENPDVYQPAAVEAAKQEFATRRLTETEIIEAKKPLIALKVKKEKQMEKIKIFEDWAKNKGYSLLETVNPVQTGIPTAEKSIRLMVMVFSGLFLYQVSRDYQLLKAYAQVFPRSPLDSAMILLPIIVLPIATIALWNKRKIGWTFLTIFLSISIGNLLWAVYQSFSWEPSGFEGFDPIFPRPSPVRYIVQLLFIGGSLYVLCKKNIRAIFRIGRNEMLATIGITAAVSFILTVANS